MRNFIFILFRIAAISLVSSLSALPLFTARAGRTCDNCHVNPFKTRSQAEWVNPKLAERKCNLSCQTCHVNPSGGGLRTAAGRYYFQNTLPMFGSKHRPYWDRNRTFASIRKWFDTNEVKTDSKVNASSTVAKNSDLTAEKKDLVVEEKIQVNEVALTRYSFSDPFVFGHPLDVRSAKDQSPYSFSHGRYAEINADPLINFGLDFRLAWLRDILPLEKSVVFPMQSDISLAIHPLEHWTILTSMGILGQANQENKEPISKRIVPRDAFVMLHQLPYQAYAKAGLFKPNFGLNIEDHTAAVRSQFELSTSTKTATVLGAELGAAPNYPYFNAAFFTDLDENQNSRGMGTTISAGWRDLAFGGGISYLAKRRKPIEAGDLDGLAINGYFNPFRLWFSFPVTMLGEIAFGSKEDSQGFSRSYIANFVELNILVVNGINLRFNHYYLDVNTEIAGDATARYGIGGDFIPLPHLRLITEFRVSRDFDSGVVSEKRWIFMLHVYL